ncbi:MAG TPA: lipopolysaccharide heptosyltransferase II [Elusimicrobiota bacterium]|nr:lipopolysaccharide heptosyltransferase II [Elusimicrobiota bacterium]
MRKILVIRLSSLGDVVLTLPVFGALRQAYPDAWIAGMTKEAYAAVWTGCPDLNQTLVFRPGEPLASAVRRVRSEHFETVIDLHGNFRARVISLLSGASQRVRYRKAALARRLFVRFRRRSEELERHTLDRYLDALKRLTLKSGAFQAAPAASPARSVLVIQTAFLGDAVLTLPLVAALHDHFPSAAITVLCTPEVSEVFRNQPGISEIMLFDKRGGGRGLVSQWRLIRTLAQKKIDVAVVPHRSLTSALMARWAGIPRRIGFSTSQGRWFMTDIVPFQWGVHDVDRNMGLMKPLGAGPRSPQLRLDPEPAEVAQVARRLASEGVSEGQMLVGIHAGSVWATKRWLPERFAAVADRIVSETGARPIFVGGSKDRTEIEGIIQRMTGPAINWAGQTNLSELIAVVARCGAFLTNDSGPMHVAVACGIPTVAIFGPTTRELGFFPYGEGHRVIEKPLPCRPCGLHGARACPLGHFECMKSITLEEVWAALKPLIEANRQAQRMAAQ